MATTNPTRTAEVHRLAAQHLSHRAIGRRLGIHHTTVGRILRTTTAPERTTPAPATAPERTTERTTTVTSGAARAPHLLYDLPADLIRDLNVLTDPRTGQLPAPLLRTIRAAAEHRRASMRATAHRIATEERTAETGRRPDRAQVAP